MSGEKIPYEIPENWAWTKINEIKIKEENFNDGDWILSENLNKEKEEVRLLQLSDIGEGEFLDKSQKFITNETFSKLKCSEIKHGDILISRMAHPIARSCIVPELKVKLITVVDIAYLRIDENFLERKYLNFLFNSDFFRKNAEKLSRGATRTRITRKNLGEINFPLPPLAEQKRIVEKLENCFSQLDIFMENKNSKKGILEKLKKSLLQQAFSGQLVPQIPEEGTGQELLQQISSQK